jgi:bifunctional non-homologous end joining protein LigD
MATQRRAQDPLDTSPFKAMPRWLRPMLPSPADIAPDGPQWLHEVKQDGHRLQIVVTDGTITLRSRNGQDVTQQFAALLPAVERLNLGRAILDGEVCVPDAAGITHLSSLHTWMRTGRGHLVFYAFDLLWLGRSEMRNLPLTERKIRMSEVLDGAEPPVVVSSYLQGHGPVVTGELCPQGAEGVISKRANSAYRGGRSIDWLKIKCYEVNDFFVVGYTAQYGQITSLLIAHPVPHGLVVVGAVVQGLAVAQAQSALPALESLRRDEPAVLSPPREPFIQWVEPRIIASIRHMGTHKNGKLRHPYLVRLRVE